MHFACVRWTHPLIKVVLTVVELLRLRLPRELYVDLRVELAAMRQFQLKHGTNTNSQETLLCNLAQKAGLLGLMSKHQCTKNGRICNWREIWNGYALHNSSSGTRQQAIKQDIAQGGSDSAGQMAGKKIDRCKSL